MKQLPKSLSRWAYRDVVPAERQNVSKLTADGRGRLIYGLCDRAQPIPHTGVILQGRELVGWILSVGKETDTDELGATTQDYMEAILPAPDHERMMRAFGAGDFRTTLALLNRKVATVHQDGDGVRDKIVTTWNRSTCEDLIRILGMIEVVPSKLLDSKRLAKPGDYDVDVLVPCEKSSHWEAVSRGEARARAAWELKSSAFWNLGSRRRDHYGEGAHFKVVSFMDTIPLETGRLGESYIDGLTEITTEHQHPSAGAIKLRAWRHNSDRLWTLDLDRPAGNQHRTYNIVSGHLALQLAELTAMQGALPEIGAATDNLDESHRVFQERVDQVHERRRELGFVCDALGLVRPAPPVAEPAS